MAVKKSPFYLLPSRARASLFDLVYDGGLVDEWLRGLWYGSPVRWLCLGYCCASHVLVESVGDFAPGCLPVIRWCGEGTPANGPKPSWWWWDHWRAKVASALCNAVAGGYDMMEAKPWVNPLNGGYTAWAWSARG